MPPLLDKENVKMTDCTNCNVFQFCQFLKLLGKIMIILVLLIVGLTYYAVIIATAMPGLHEGGAGTVTWSLFVLIMFHILVGCLDAAHNIWAWHCSPSLADSALYPEPIPVLM